MRPDPVDSLVRSLVLGAAEGIILGCLIVLGTAGVFLLARAIISTAAELMRLA